MRPPVRIRTIHRGTCPVCAKPVSLRLGYPRAKEPKPAPGKKESDPLAKLFAIAVLAVCMLILPGCATAPYYVSAVNLDGELTDGHQSGRVGIILTPNPAYRTLPTKEGLAK